MFRFILEAKPISLNQSRFKRGNSCPNEFLSIKYDLYQSFYESFEVYSQSDIVFSKTLFLRVELVDAAAQTLCNKCRKFQDVPKMPKLLSRTFSTSAYERQNPRGIKFVTRLHLDLTNLLEHKSNTFFETF